MPRNPGAQRVILIASDMKLQLCRISGGLAILHLPRCPETSPCWIFALHDDVDPLPGRVGSVKGQGAWYRVLRIVDPRAVNRKN